MRQIKLRMAALVFCLLLLAGCGGESGTAAPEEKNGPDAVNVEDVPKTEDEPAAEPVENLFETMPQEFMFCSGAGGWSTTLTLEPDGSFTGVFHDSDMGVANTAAFPNGTMYLCNFSGKFTQPEQADDFIYSIRLESLELEHPADGSEEIVDGVRHIYFGPYGLENAGELRIYLPDVPVSGLPEGAVWAARGPYNWEKTSKGTLGLYVIYNVEEDLGFAEYPRVTEEE